MPRWSCFHLGRPCCGLDKNSRSAEDRAGRNEKWRPARFCGPPGLSIGSLKVYCRRTGKMGGFESRQALDAKLVRRDLCWQSLGTKRNLAGRTFRLSALLKEREAENCRW